MRMRLPAAVKARLRRGLRWLRNQPERPSGLGVHVAPLGDMYYNEVLRNEDEVTRAIGRLHWEHPVVRWKAWDLLKVAHFVLQHAPRRETRILDVGCNGSPILEVLYSEGYRRLFGCDFVGTDPPLAPGLVFHQGDLMNTPWPDGHFGTVSCVSVIEHGFNQQKVLHEMARLLEPGGYLLVSTDYADPKIETSDVDLRTSFGMPWIIFCRSEIEEFVRAAGGFGFTLTQPIRWDQEQQLVSCWGKSYTFIFLAFQKK
jgi:SAM-dependent methyltransferase